MHRLLLNFSMNNWIMDYSIERYYGVVLIIVWLVLVVCSNGWWMGGSIVGVIEDIRL